MKLPLLAVAGLCLGTCLHAQTPLRLSGSTTVQGALQSRQAALEKDIGRRIEFSGMGTTAGLLSLLAGRADIAMLSSPLDEVAQKVAEKKGGGVDVAQFRATEIGRAKIVFIVNPRNPVRQLSAAQLADLLEGKITNWKEVGGADAPVLVVSLANAGSIVQEKLLHGASITATARAVPNATQIPGVVAQEPNAIGIISAAHVHGQTSVIQTDADVFTPLILVTRGAPGPDAQKLIDHARLLLGGSS
jgi:phosphate transport system substrate-binding protein